MKHKFKISAPNSFVIIFLFILLAGILTYLVPAGEYDRIADETGQMLVVADSFHYVSASPVNPFELLICVAEAFISSSDIIFCILFAYCFMGILNQCGVFQALFGLLLKKLKHRKKILLPSIILLFALMGSVAGIAEETFGMFPICISLAIAMGYDRIVGGSIVYLAVFTGFASATFNPFTIGIAQSIAGVPMYSGLGFRVFCFVIFVSILIVYVMRYAAKLEKNPGSSLLQPEHVKINDEETQGKLQFRQVISLLVFLGILTLIVTGAIRLGWYIKEITGLFFAGYLLIGLINGYRPNQLTDTMVTIGSETLFSMLIIGFSNAICVVLTHGNIIDTIVYGMETLLKGTSGYASAVLMLILQNLLNFFIPSGPGQAAVSMPIMSSFADVAGLSRQLSVLVFQFGDGFSNIFWPTMVCMMCGIMKIPVGKWYKYITPLFGIMFVAEVALIILAVAVGY